MQKTLFSQKPSKIYSYGLYWRPIGSRTWAFQRTHYGTPKTQDGWDAPSWKSTWSHFFCRWWSDWTNSMACHPRATCHIAGCKNSIRHIEIVFRHILFFLFFNAVWALTGGGFRVVSDTLVKSTLDKCIDGVCDAIIYSPNYMPSEENENQGP